MASMRAPSLVGICCRPAQLLRLQKRWARVQDVRLLATHHTQERVTDRYRQKLEEKAKQEGAKDIGELKETYKEKITELKKKASVPGATAPAPSAPQPAAKQTSQSKSPWPQAPSPPEPQPNYPAGQDPSAYKKPGLKTLSSFLDLEKTMDLPQKEIEAIWRLRHAHTPASLCAVMPKSTWASVYRTARRHPQFILPGLPRKTALSEAGQEEAPEEGAPIHFMQWTFPSPNQATVIFTHLAEYKLRGEYAQPHTTLTHHMELADPKGLVLCEGNVIENCGVTLEEGKWLVMNMQKFYNIGQEIEEADDSQMGRELKQRRRRLVELFSTGNSEFRVEDLLEEAERMG